MSKFVDDEKEQVPLLFVEYRSHDEYQCPKWQYERG